MRTVFIVMVRAPEGSPFPLKVFVNREKADKEVRNQQGQYYEGKTEDVHYDSWIESVYLVEEE